MRVLHVTAFHISLTTGGTELYIEGLKAAFKSVYNAENYVVVFSTQRPQIEQNDNRIEYHSPNGKSLMDLTAFKEECNDIIQRIQPDCVVFHTVDNYEGMLVNELLKSNIPFAFILHAPYWLCYQRNRMFNCYRPCHKMFAPFLCACCSWHGNGSSFLRAIKSLVGEALRLVRLTKSSRYYEIRRELCLKEDVVRNATAVIALNQRDYDAFIENWIPKERLHLLPTALSEDVLSQCKQNAQKERHGVLKILCAGRFCEVKGSNILVEAAHSLSEEYRFQLDFYGVRDEKEAYVQEGKRLAERDSRIRILPMLPHEVLIKAYADYDIQCLPSTVFDNGPLALWEGAYSGCRIATSENVGQRAFVAQYGEVIVPNTVEAWLRFFKHCVEDLRKLRESRIKSFQEYNSMNTIAKKLVDYLGNNTQRTTHNE